MRIFSRELTSGLLLALLTALLFLAPSGRTYAQSQKRSFQMSMWMYPSTAVPTPKVDTDIPTFYDEEGQQPPTGPSIVVQLVLGTPLTNRGYDWSRILAIEADEPYKSVEGAQCSEDISGIDQILAARAAELKSIAPATRFWVNFSAAQVAWMRKCNITLNRSYIDVVSYDDYSQPFDSNIEGDYQWLLANPQIPQQQIALLPGTFCTNGACAQASYLQGYFNYANTENQSCNLPIGPRGRTGSFDGCPVWIVMGWLSGTSSANGTTYTGELDSDLIYQPWRAEVSLPLSPALAHQVTRQQMLQTFLPLLLTSP